MRSLRLTAAAVACLSAVAVLTACDPEGTDTGDSAASAAPSTASTAAPSAAGSASPAASKSQGAPEATPGKAGRLPAGVWIDPKAVPLNSALHWKAGPAKVLGEKGRLRIEELCKIPREDSFAEVPMVETAALGGAAGDWAADETIASFGSSAKSSGAAQSAYGLLSGVTEGLKGCASTVPGATVKVTVEDGMTVAATLTVPQSGGGSTEVHEYLTAKDGTLAELTLHAQLPKGGHPKTAWAGGSDDAVLNPLAAPVCTAFADC
ncbi:MULTISPECIES: hypothetical protein [Kitasatospora]|uniref:hypothetical protein n=1 Tax=Kitasatospora TaxID=2063 RepID=UPI0004C2FE69|nr:MULTISPECIES: hypothetical protein [unclassified Kitasatospora]WAL70644.1 hypothetical protein OU787_03515 [Kitasatospora sp. YST-16]WNW36685.1 hypothetical protein RKE32_03505 [Streptomyces sp. Li-HN-5-13]